MKAIIFSTAHTHKLAHAIAKHNKITRGAITINHFPDGESYLRIHDIVAQVHAVLVQSMHPYPNDALIESTLFAHTAKELGAKKVTLIAPYLAYLRQDKRFNDGEAVSNKIIAHLLDAFDSVVTVDPHLHRIKNLNEIFKTKIITLSANGLLATWVCKNIKQPIIIGPDAESFQWAKNIAQSIDSDFAILQKTRHASRNVSISLDDPHKYTGRNVVIIDDIISTGHTMLEPIKKLKYAGAKTITCLCVHALLVENAKEKIEKLGARIVSTDSIMNSTTKITLASKFSLIFAARS